MSQFSVLHLLYCVLLISHPNASSCRFVTISSEQTHYLSLTLGHILVILTVFHTFSSLFLSVMMNCSQWCLRPASQLLWAHKPYSYRSARAISIMFGLLQRSASLHILLCSSLPSPRDTTTLKLHRLVALHGPVCVPGKGRVMHLSL